MLGIVDLAGRVRSRLGILLLASVSPAELTEAGLPVRTLLLVLGTNFLFGVFPKKELEDLETVGEAVPL